MHPISDLQIEYSLISRGIEAEILPTCRKLGIGITAYGVLSRGLISGHWTRAHEGEHDFRGISPRFQGANLDANLGLVETLRESPRGSEPRWRRSPSPGWRRKDRHRPAGRRRRRDRLAEALGALNLTLSADDLAKLAKALPPGAAAGERYPAAALAHMDSEKKRARAELKPCRGLVFLDRQAGFPLSPAWQFWHSLALSANNPDPYQRLAPSITGGEP